MTEPDLVAEGLACRRGERLVFAGLSFRLPAGGALLLTGANGSGKTSLLRVLARLLAAPASIWLLDEPTSALDHENQSRLERAIAEHRAAGGRVVVASHTPIDIDPATAIALDAFAPLSDHAAG